VGRLGIDLARQGARLSHLRCEECGCDLRIEADVEGIG